VAVIDKGICGKHKMTLSLDYEIKPSKKFGVFDCTLPKKEMRQSLRDINRLGKALVIMAKHGWNVQQIEVGVDD
jgi:hypothetical protein